MNSTLALSLTIFGALLLAAVLLDEVAGRARIPGILLVLVLALLRPLQDRLPRRVIDLIETESALNDPVAVVVCGLALAMAGGGQAAPDALVAAVLRQFLLGITIGFLGDSLTVQLLLGRRGFSESSLLAVVSLSLLMVLAGGTELLGGSSLLAAYIAGLVIGNSAGIERSTLVEAHAGFTKMAELMLFLCMGLVVTPVAVVRDLAPALSVAALLLLSRWLVVHSLLLNTPFERPERHFIALAGLRGAVPIAVAIQASASDVPWGARMPALALTVVLCGLLGQGFLLIPAAQRLGLTAPGGRDAGGSVRTRRRTRGPSPAGAARSDRRGPGSPAARPASPADRGNGAGPAG
jgi:NhaP-type Na+/H+ and K+/H+ antiporter